jgi:hypothetical protein
MWNRREVLTVGAGALGAAALAPIGAATGRKPPSAAAGPHRVSERPGIGALLPWQTYQSEDMHSTGMLMGPKYEPNCVETESSNQRCVKLRAAGEYVEFTVKAYANAVVIRYSLPDSPDGGGIGSSLHLYRNGQLSRSIPIHSKFSWLYGDYPFTNDPRAGKPRHFYDEVRLMGIELAAGDVVRLAKGGDDGTFCIIDLVDLEDVAPPPSRPEGSLSATDLGARGDGTADDTSALRHCIAEAARQHKTAWVPPGVYKLTGDVAIPSGVTMQGAGMWHTSFVGDEELYDHPDRRVRLKLVGTDSHIADVSLIGNLTYRNDNEQNDGIFGAHAKKCTVSRVWVEHTKVGMWFYVCDDVQIVGCRIRNTLADGINLCVDVRNCVIDNCTARNTGDDCFAIWPTPHDQTFTQELPRPGNNVIRRCTGQVPFLANGGAIYGGADNRIEDCRFSDIGVGSGILISTTFPTSNDELHIDNNFSGDTVVRNCELARCGGFDHAWGWRAALQICVDHRDISGLSISNVHIADSISDGVAVIARKEPGQVRALTESRLVDCRIVRYGLGTSARHGFWVGPNVRGALLVENCDIPESKNDSPDFAIITG